MKVKNARDVAVSAITAFRKRNAWSDGYLRNEIRSCNLDNRDAALATEIVNGVLQNSFFVNYYISKFSSVKLNKIAPGILDILQVAVYQILFLDKVPDSAAINDAVGRAKRNNVRAAGFVNALTRKISSEKENLPQIIGEQSEVLSVRYSHPVWFVKKLCSIFGVSEAEKILEYNNRKAQTSVRVNTIKTTFTELKDAGADEGILFEKGIVPESAYIKFSGNIDKSPLFANGMFYIQDSASQVAALTLNPLPNSKVLDACAAPGGKSFLMAQLMNNSGEIISCDVHDHKLSIIDKGAQKLGISIIRPEFCDSSRFREEFNDRFDYILADVPCSGFGIIRKKPDIRYKTEEEIKNLPRIQLEILKNVSRYVKKGGALLYSTCTILPQENSDVIKAFLDENGEFAEEIEYMDIPHIKNDFGITFLPHISNTDGFYICKLRRQK